MPGGHGRTGGAARASLRAAGEALITLGVVVLLFAVYLLYGTGWSATRDQAALEQELARQWAGPPPPGPSASRPPATPATPAARPGSPVAIVAIPALGRDFRRVVVEGVGPSELEKGPGHYPGTAMPGQVGNVVIAGHRTTYGAPFSRLDELSVGDTVTVTDRGGAYQYRITGAEVVAPSDTAVVLPVPRRPGQAPTRRLLTLITCTPKYSAKARLVLTGEMAPRPPPA